MRRLRLRAVAEAEIARTFDLYLRERPALGATFLEAVIATLDRIVDRPESFPVLHGDLRRALMGGRFPYCIYFRLRDDVVTVVACVHAKRDPRRWQVREPISA